mgnify:CR=1 FL=1
MDKEAKKISVIELLKEFEARYNQLTMTKRTLLELEKFILLLSASNRSYREKLVAFLDDWTIPTCLVSHCNGVHEASNRISYRPNGMKIFRLSGVRKELVLEMK